MSELNTALQPVVINDDISLVDVISSAMQEVFHDHDASFQINVDLFHKHQVRTHVATFQDVCGTLLALAAQSQHRLAWIHAVESGPEVILRIGHAGTPRENWQQDIRAVENLLENIGITLEFNNLSDNRQEYIIRLPISRRAEPRPAPAPSFDLNLSETSPKRIISSS